MASLFSERNGFTKSSNVIVKGKITKNIVNALSSCFTLLKEDLDDADYRISDARGDEDWLITSNRSFYKMDRTVWMDFMNKMADKYVGGIKMRQYDAVQMCLLDEKSEWYKKLDCVEFAIEYMRTHFTDSIIRQVVDDFVQGVNRQFERLNYGYRIVQGRIVDMASEIEIKAIDKSVESDDNVSFHMLQALKLYSLKPNPDFRNSIKESITAVETLFREITNENTFGQAYDKIKKRITIHPRLGEMIQKMYVYTNQKDTGIRHAKVEADNTYLPTAEEAMLMLVTCSATINYVRGKLGTTK